MKRNNPRVDMINISEDSINFMGRKSADYRSFFLSCLVIMLLGIAVLMPFTGNAQTMDEAVKAQLESINISGDNIACGRLVQNGGTFATGSGLETICGRGVVGGTPPPTSVAGGNAAAPTTLPSIVKNQMEEQKDTEKQKTGSSDSVEVGKKLSLYISGEYEGLNRDATKFEDGYDSDIGRLTAGADVQFTDRFLAGLAFDTSRHNGDFDGGGDFDITSYGIIVYGSFLPIDNVFVQVHGGYTAKSNERERTASFTDENGNVTSGTPNTDYDIDEYSAGIQVGYDHPFGSITIGPRAALDWIDTNFDTYSETDASGLALTFHNDEVSSLRSTVGVQCSTAISAAFGVVMPQASVSWKHEYDQDQRNVQVSFVDDTSSTKFTFQTEAPDRDFYEFNAGVSLVLTGGVQTFINYRTLFGHSFLNSHAGTIGMRIEL